MTNIKTFHFQNEESISSDSSEWQGTQTTQSNCFLMWMVNLKKNQEKDFAIFFSLNYIHFNFRNFVSAL